jgi:uncharacterized membrane protein YphA (DoxX/SURF4 family)
VIGSLIQLTPQTQRRIAFGLQVILGGIFVYAGISKLLDPLRFSASILGYQLIPVGLVRPIVYGMPWIEIGLGSLFFVGKYPRFSAGGIAILLAIFTLMLAYALSQGWIIDCGCFGKPRPVDGSKIVENLIMVLIALRFYLNPALMVPMPEWRSLVEGKA